MRADYLYLPHHPIKHGRLLQCPPRRCHTEAALTHLHGAGVDVAPEDVERLAPLGSAHITMLGRYQFTLAEPVLRGELRELRDPTQDQDLLAV